MKIFHDKVIRLSPPVCKWRWLKLNFKELPSIWDCNNYMDIILTGTLLWTRDGTWINMQAHLIRRGAVHLFFLIGKRPFLLLLATSRDSKDSIPWLKRTRTSLYVGGTISGEQQQSNAIRGCFSSLAWPGSYKYNYKSCNLRFLPL